MRLRDWARQRLGKSPEAPGLGTREKPREMAGIVNKVYSHANKTHFHKKSFAFNLVLKVRVSGTRKWLNQLRPVRCPFEM